MDAPSPQVLTDEQFANRLREAGLRVTRPRLAVYSALRRLGGHRSADEVLTALGRRLTRMTVYNSLRALVEAGVLLRADAGPGRALFEANSVWHHHFVCRRCGKIADVSCVKGRKPCLKPPGQVGNVDEAQIIFRGVCLRCS